MVYLGYFVGWGYGDTFRNTYFNVLLFYRGQQLWPIKLVSPISSLSLLPIRLLINFCSNNITM